MRRKISAVLLALLLCIGILNTISFALEDNAFSTGDWIAFGSYPQTLVENIGLSEELDALPKTWHSFGYFSGNGTWNDGNMKSSDFMQYADITLDGVRYRAVTFSAYRSYSTGIAGASDTSYQRANGYIVGGVYYFKYEPILWRVLSPETGLVMSTVALDSQPYQNFVSTSASGYYNAEGHFASDWETSSIRAWLNADFLQTAFTAGEQSRISDVTLQNKSVFSDLYNSANTVDKVFLLSYQDALNAGYGFASRYSSFDKARQLVSTDYAKCQGCASSSEADFSGNCWWFLRSPSDSGYVSGATYYGKTSSHYSYVNDTFGGVVPALCMDGLSKCSDHDDEIIRTTEPTGLTDGECIYRCKNCLRVYVEPVSAQHLPGDVNGDGACNLKDVVAFKRFLAGWKVQINAKNADVNGDNLTNLLDVLLVERFLAGWDVTLK